MLQRERTDTQLHVQPGAHQQWKYKAAGDYLDLVHEHIFKIVGAFDALTATFAATVLPQYQPWSAIVPNVCGTLVILGFFVVGRAAWRTPSSRLRLAPEVE